MTFENLKGTFDFQPKDQILINKILGIIKSSYESFGFRPFDTPIIEYFDTLTNKYDEEDEIVGEIFKVADRGNRKLGLRYDLTVPLCRFIAQQKQLKLPFRRYQIGKNYRDGPIKPGRLREFTQCDGDVIGIKGQEIEAELLNLFYSTYKKLGINAIIEINNNKILRGALLQEGFKEDQLQSLILSIDKLKKIGEKGVLEEIKQKNLNITKAKKALKTLSCKTIAEIKKLAKDETIKEGIKEFDNLLKLNDNLFEFRINFSMSRGLNIYTSNIWEAYDKNNAISSSIGSGGRYDKAIGNYIENGMEYPAVGISFGLTPILACLKSNNQKESKIKIQ